MVNDPFNAECAEHTLWQPSPLPSVTMGHQWWCLTHGEHTRSEAPMVAPPLPPHPLTCVLPFYSRHWLLCRQKEMCISGWGTQGSSMEHLCRSLFSATNWLLYCLLSLWSYLSWLISLPVKGLPRVQNLSSFPAPSQWGRSHLDSLLFHPIQLCGDHSCIFGCLRYSAKVQ